MLENGTKVKIEENLSQNPVPAPITSLSASVREKLEVLENDRITGYRGRVGTNSVNVDVDRVFGVFTWVLGGG
ncbi:unnamed protein product [Clavelina lepadiformis]|uniref:Uncharacterized protein n=1 Tax=Clavelina lepadiformis TaxID=159417 RepID=A0ABP0G6E7_CLALP